MKMKIKSKISLFSVLAAGMVLSIPFAFFQQTSNVITTKKTFNTKASSWSSINATDVNTNFTWSADDIYASTQGMYVYGDEDFYFKDIWLYKISKDGVTINPKHPTYNKILNHTYNGVNGTIPRFDLGENGIAHYVNYSNGVYTTGLDINQYRTNLAVGNAGGPQKLTAVKSFVSNAATPAFTFDMLRWEWSVKEPTENDYSSFTNAGINEMLISSLNYETFIDENKGSFTPLILASNSEVIDQSSPDGALDFRLTKDTKLISVFNDYATDGTYLKTYMYPDGFSVNSSATIDIDETAFDKALPPESNNLSNMQDVITLNLENVPQNFLENMTVEAEPNGLTGEINFKLLSKYIISNGELIENPFPANPIATKTIGGFLKTNTKIEQLSTPKRMVVDEFMDYVSTGGVADPNKLGEFLDLSNTVVPAGAIYKITAEAPDLVTGEIKILLIVDRYYDLDNNVVNADAKFSLTLKILPKTTAFFNLTSAAVPVKEVTTTLFDSNLVANAEFFNHIDVKALPQNSMITLKPASVITDEANGLISFDVSVSEYYNNQAAIARNGTFKINDLQAWPTATTIGAKNTYVAKLRADNFVSTIADTANPDNGMYLVTDLETLQEYVDFFALPNTNVYIKDNYTFNGATGDITFTVVVASANDGSGGFISNLESTPLSFVMKVTPKPTEFGLNADADLTITPDDFIAKLLPNGVLDEKFLWNYVELTGELPADSVISIDPDYAIDLNAGTVDFNILASSYYDAQSVQKENGSFLINLVVATKFNPTVLTVRSGYDNSLEPEAFIQYVAPAGVLNKANLFEFIEVNQEDPSNEIGFAFDPNDTSYSETTGKVFLGLKLTNYYDSKSVLNSAPKTFVVEIQVGVKAQKPELKLLEAYYKNIKVSDFVIQTLDPTVSSIDGLAKWDGITRYVDIKYLNSTSTINMQIVSADETKGTVVIRLWSTVSGFEYDEEFSLQLLGNTSIPKDTGLASLAPEDKTTVNRFIRDVQTAGVTNIQLLRQYVDLSTVPQDAVITLGEMSIVGNDVKFDIMYDKAFVNGVVTTGTFKHSATVNLAPNLPITSVVANYKINWETSPTDFWVLVTTKNNFDLAKFEKYVGIVNLPENAVITLAYEDIVKDIKTGALKVALHTDRYYDDFGDLYVGGKSFQFNLSAVATIVQNTDASNFLWLYISGGLVGLIIIVSIILLIRRKSGTRNFYSFKRDQY